jgi:lysophospholipase L1-like esterase
MAPYRLRRILARVVYQLSAGFMALIFCAAARVQAASAQSDWKFWFEAGEAKPGYLVVSTNCIFSQTNGYGFDRLAKGANGPIAERVRFFSVVVPEGNYNVTATLGDLTGESATTIKAESRRLMVENVRTPSGQFSNVTFTVNVRMARIAGGGEVRLKSRELGPPMVLHWDDKLTLEFNGGRPRVCALEIRRVEDAITVFLAGDSTVTDQPREPWNSWGQMLPCFFKPGVAVANHAESGESLPSFLNARRFDKILGAMKAGDYLFIQFGHNDQKDKRPGAGAYTTYKTNLLHLIAKTRQRGGIPVLVTPMHRMRFETNGTVPNTLGDFPDAVRQVAREAKVALIDLNNMSKVFYEALGPQKCKLAFQDGTHHNNYGSYELANCIVEGIKANHLGLTRFLAEDVAPFDPAHPDPVEKFAVPASPLASQEKPDGN